MRIKHSKIGFLRHLETVLGLQKYVLPLLDLLLRRQPVGKHPLPAILDPMAQFLDTLRLARDRYLLALVRFHDGLVQVG